MADGITSLNSISWGTSTGGAAGSAESTLTLGVDRSDTRTPPDTNHIWAAQLNNVKAAVLAISQTFKGGTRLGLLTQTSNPFGASESGFYINTSGQAFFVFNGTPTAIGSGSASTGNWTFTGNVADLSGAGALTLGGATATSISLAKAAVSLAANTVMTGASSATNTVGLTLAPNVADGASSVALSIDTGTTLANATSRFMRVRNLTTELFSMRPFNTDGVEMRDGGGSSFLQLSTNVPAKFGYGGANVSVGSSVAITDGTGILTLSSGTASCSLFSVSPDSDNSSSRTLGTSSLRWGNVFASRYSGLTQTVAAAGTLTINPASGGHIRITLSATAITSLTISAGNAGEVITVEVIQDATGSRSIPTTWTNVAFAGGTYTATTTLNKRDVLTFRYDATDLKWYEQSRSMNC